MNRTLSIINAFGLLFIAIWLVVSSRAPVHAQASEAIDYLRIKKLELTDGEGKVRAALEVGRHSNSSPQLLMYGPDGRESIVMTLDAQGNGILSFQSATMNGKVGLGYLADGQAGALTERELPFAGWGLRVMAKSGRKVMFGLLNNGEPISSAR